jgi:VWFA-related protein
MDRCASEGALIATKVLALTAAGLLAAGLQDPPRQVFRSAAHAVAVDVAVFEGRNVATSLTAANFEVFDNGVKQTISSVDLNRLPIDLRLVFDTSGSITPEGLEQYRRAMRLVADALRPDDRCEIVSFTTRVTTAATRQSPPVSIDLQRLAPEGTAFFDAVSLALVAAPSPDRRRIVIVLSDARDNTSFFDEAALVDVAKRTDAVVYTVLPSGVGADVTAYASRLQSLSLLTGGRLVPGVRDTQISSVLIDAINEFRHSYVLRYTLKGANTPGWHKLTVRVNGPRFYSVRARAGYFLG